MDKQETVSQNFNLFGGKIIAENRPMEVSKEFVKRSYFLYFIGHNDKLFCGIVDK